MSTPVRAGSRNSAHDADTEVELRGHRAAPTTRWRPVRSPDKSCGRVLQEVGPRVIGSDVSLQDTGAVAGSGFVCRQFAALAGQPCTSSGLSVPELVDLAAGSGDDLDVKTLMHPAELLPQGDAASEDQWHGHQMHEVDQVGMKELPDRARSSAESYVLAVGCLARLLE